MNRARCEELATKMYDKTRPEFPNVVHEERRELAAFVVDAINSGKPFRWKIPKGKRTSK